MLCSKQHPHYTMCSGAIADYSCIGGSSLYNPVYKSSQPRIHPPFHLPLSLPTKFQKRTQRRTCCSRRRAFQNGLDIQSCFVRAKRRTKWICQPVMPRLGPPLVDRKYKSRLSLAFLFLNSSPHRLCSPKKSCQHGMCPPFSF